jgi:fimbrial isopeptide formation D2 family protein
VTVAGGGDTTLHNKVAPPAGSLVGKCVPAPDETPNCETVQKYGGYTFSKTSNPKSGSTVASGDRIDYTLTVTQTGAAPTTGTVVDDLSKVLDDATWVGNQKATSGTVTREGNKLTWKGDLAIGQVVTITYSVTVNDNGDGAIKNVVTSPDKTAACVPAADQNPDCTTNQTVKHPGAGLADTGSDLTFALLAALGLFGAGLGLALTRRRRRA